MHINGFWEALFFGGFVYFSISAPIQTNKVHPIQTRFLLVGALGVAGLFSALGGAVVVVPVMLKSPKKLRTP